MQHQFKNVIPKRFLPMKPIGILILLFGLFISGCGGSDSSSSSTSSVKISGQISAQRDSDIDLDLNASGSLNDDNLNPQIIANPTTIGGYLSGFSGTYSTGQIFNADLADYFSVSLVEGQAVQLSLFQADDAFNAVDVQLALRDQEDNILTSLSFNDFASESLAVPADGLYLISITATDSSSPLLYTLSLSQTISSQSLSQSDYEVLSKDFVPGEVLIKFKSESGENQFQKPNQTVTSVASSTTHSLLSNESQIQTSVFQGLTLKEEIPNVARLYELDQANLTQAFSFTDRSESFEEGITQSSISQNSITQSSISQSSIYKGNVSEELLEQKIQTLELIKQLQALDSIEFAEPNYIFHAAATTNDPRLKDQWSLNMLANNAVWEVATGQGVIVAVLDTGIDASHEDLSANVLSDGYDFISSKASAGDGNGFDADPNDEGTSFHGSHVAGIIAAEANNNKGIAGLAYNSKIMSLRVLGIQNSGTSSDIAQAILYAAGLTNNSGNVPNQRADIINMSFGTEALSESVKSAIDKAANEGLILIAAAGNLSVDTPFYPAAFDNVIGVGSISNDKQRSSFSNFGQNVQVVAPGGTGSGSATFDGFQDAILSTINANNYTENLGTSMAAPHVSATAALMKELKTDLNNESFKSALALGALTQVIQSQVVDSQNYFGEGLIDPAKAVNWAAGTTIIPATLGVYPQQFGFIGANTEAELSLTNPGSGEVSIVSIDESESWLAITAKNVSDAGLGTYLVEVSPLQAPVEQGSILLNYRVNNGALQQQTLKVFVSRSTQSDSTVGVLYISLFKEEDILNDVFTPFRSGGASLNDSVYDYCLDNIPSGRYLLTASTDNDGDKLPFDKGEAIGTYPIHSSPQYIEVKNTDLSQINFDIQYPSYISSSEVGISPSFRANLVNNQAGNMLNITEEFFSQGTCSN